MNILYVSSLCTPQTFSALFPDVNKMPGQQVQKYHRLLIEGLSSNKNIIVQTISNFPVNSSNCTARYIRAKSETYGNVQFRYLSACNIFLVKSIFNLIQSFFLVCNKKNSTVVICDVLNVSVSIGALLAAKLLGIPSVGIVTDVPKFLFKNTKKTWYKIATLLMNSFDSYVLLTEAMTEVVDCRNKPYVVIEGQVDIHMEKITNRMADKYNKKVCIYAGGLQRLYGIPYMVQAFLEADVANSELHIYGSGGDYIDELNTLCKQHSSIRYMGVRPNVEVVEEELKATLLINPRPTLEEYTKYSFPSKNMEYMVSGTPLLTTKLSGMPSEYCSYVFLIEDESVKGLALNLKKILSQTPESLNFFGKRAKDFVLKEKNNVKQARKILDMIEGML